MLLPCLVKIWLEVFALKRATERQTDGRVTSARLPSQSCSQIWLGTQKFDELTRYSTHNEWPRSHLIVTYSSWKYPQTVAGNTFEWLVILPGFSFNAHRTLRRNLGGWCPCAHAGTLTSTHPYTFNPPFSECICIVVTAFWRLFFTLVTLTVDISENWCTGSCAKSSCMFMPKTVAIHSVVSALGLSEDGRTVFQFILMGVA